MVQVVLKTFDILELVSAKSGQGVTLTEISNELQMNQATTANIIKTMASKGYLEHIGKKKGYRLGPAAFRLANVSAYGENLVNAAKDNMEQLTAKLNESSILGVLRNHKRYVLHVVNSKQEIQVQVRTERSVYETATGRLLLAYLPEKDLERSIQKNGLPDEETWKEATTKTKLLEALEKIRQDGMVMTYAPTRHIRGFAVPVFAQEKVVAGLSVFLPDYRYTVARQRQIMESLKQASEAISQRVDKSRN
jgi:IclR family transcriptional regulator, KDG regulon repressor